MTAAMERLGAHLDIDRGRAEGQAARKEIRERAAKVIADPGTVDDVELMAAEAIANAVLHGTGTIRVTICTDGVRLRVEVRDQGPRDLDVHGRNRIDHGRGLAVIDALATEWGLDRSESETHLWFVV
ncbi:ATP-binding protein [Spirillospora sp. CA-294931]|uniref:ATP-binding protein n=1 Tax=Spirillospora sp. CA-294931 TaxID=3240042 RepID=UPI003D8EAFC6